MADLETRIHGWVDSQTADTAPVTMTEIIERATMLPIEAGRDPRPRPVVTHRLTVAAVVLLIVATLAAALLLLVSEQDQPVVTDTEEGLGVYLAWLPDDTGSSAELVDLEAARVTTGVARPSPGASLAESARYLQDLTSAQGDAFNLPRRWLVTLSDLDEGDDPFEHLVAAVWDELGIDLAHLRSWASVVPVHVSEGVSILVLSGDFDEETVERAVTETSAAADASVTREYRGVRYFGWHDGDESDVERGTLINRSGHQRRVVVIDAKVVITGSDEAMEWAIDRALDRAPAGPPTGMRGALARLLEATGPGNPPWDVSLPATSGPRGPHDPVALAVTSTLTGSTGPSWPPRVAVFVLADEHDAATMFERYEHALDVSAEMIGDPRTRDQLASSTTLSIIGNVATFTMDSDPMASGHGRGAYTRMVQVLATGVVPS